MTEINSIPPRQLVPGIMGHYVHGVNCTLGYVNLNAGSSIPEHHHIHEQITFIVEGELDMVIGGKKILLTTGHVYVIPPDIPHSAVAKTDCRVIDVFSPVREDYK